MIRGRDCAHDGVIEEEFEVGVYFKTPRVHQLECVSDDAPAKTCPFSLLRAAQDMMKTTAEWRSRRHPHRSPVIRPASLTWNSRRMLANFALEQFPAHVAVGGSHDSVKGRIAVSSESRASAQEIMAHAAARITFLRHFSIA